MSAREIQAAVKDVMRFFIEHPEKAVVNGIALTALEVTVDSTSDNRGLLQIDDSIPAGPLEVRVHVKLGGAEVSKDRLRELVAWTERHSPVGGAVSAAVPLKMSVEVV